MTVKPQNWIIFHYFALYSTNYDLVDSFRLDLEAAKNLQEKINSACDLLADYNQRLSAEQVDRELTQRMLVDYIAMQKYQHFQNEKKVEVSKIIKLF